MNAKEFNYRKVPSYKSIFHISPHNFINKVRNQWPVSEFKRDSLQTKVNSHYKVKRRKKRDKYEKHIGKLIRKSPKITCAY